MLGDSLTGGDGGTGDSGEHGESQNDFFHGISFLRTRPKRSAIRPFDEPGETADGFEAAAADREKNTGERLAAAVRARPSLTVY